MNYKKTYTPKNGVNMICRHGECSLKIMDFGIIELEGGQSTGFSTEDREFGFVILSGEADFSFGNTVWRSVGGRRSVFEGKAHSVYMPRRTELTLTAGMHTAIAFASCPVDEDTQPQLLKPENTRSVILGAKPCERYNDFLIDERSNAKHLTIGEAWITPGNWAGYPPHKHDEDKMPDEGIYEEIYFYQFQPGQGFALQRMYTKDGSIDECYTAKHNDVIEFPRGYHTTVAAPGYNSYFLWMSAGEYQGFYRSYDSEHEWYAAAENMLKKL